MQQTVTSLKNRPAWIDLSSPDPQASRDFYAKLLGWQIEVSDDPQYGGYATARIGERSVGGIGPKQDPGAPTAWLLYIGTDDIDALARDVANAGGTVVVEPFDVGKQGRMAVFQDPCGAFISAWQSAPGTHASTFLAGAPNAFGWAELNARGVERAIPFYEQVFGWTHRSSETGAGQPPYNEFLLDGESILGAWEMNPAVPAQVPSYWQVYFTVADLDATYENALELGAREMVGPSDYPGGRFAIVIDPQGASFGLLQAAPGR